MTARQIAEEHKAAIARREKALAALMAAKLFAPSQPS